MLSRFFYKTKNCLGPARLTAALFSEVKKFENNFLSTTNVAYIEDLYEKWLEDKSSVSPSFDAYF